MEDLHTRRTFLRAATAAGVAWAAADFLQVDEALAWATQQVGAGSEAAVSVLTKAQADALDAMTSRVLPSIDGKPGAHEAGVVFFIDRALATFNAGHKNFYVKGIADLDRRAVRKWKGTRSFASLTAAQQDELLREIENTPFFQTVRLDTIFGTFALPTWGGNRDHLGWHMLGMDHQTRFQAPFGYYDADINRRS